MKLPLYLLGVLAWAPLFGADNQPEKKPIPPSQKPNIIYFLCDDLGIGELGCYGQTKIKTPNIDALAQKGMLFTQHYSGSCVCAPSRCTLMTGKHTGQSFIRGNREFKPEGQLAIPENTPTLAKFLKQKGYQTACVGKWGLGPVGSSGDPLKQGFDHFFGYNCQRHAHSYYTSYLWRDSQKETINGGKAISGHGRLDKGADPMNKASYAKFIGEEWTPDLMITDAVNWIEKQKDTPFFLYYATPLPHVALQVPETRVATYHGLLGEEKPYLGEQGYLPARYPRATYAAMVSKIDEDVGVLMETLKKNHMDLNTLIIFCSDNGPTFNGGTQSSYFRSARDARGLKCSVYEGGLRVPMIAVWPGHIAPGTTSNHISAMWDVFPTVCEISGDTPPEDLSGISFLPTLTGKKQNQKTHEYLYWENTEQGRTEQALRWGDFKLVRHLNNKEKMEFFNLAEDPQEKHNLAKSQPKKVKEFLEKINHVRTNSAEFPIKQ